MKKTEKIKFLHDNHFKKWLDTQYEVKDELSRAQSVFCICGRLATGLHETNCRKFKAKIINETLMRLDHLISQQEGE